MPTENCTGGDDAGLLERYEKACQLLGVDRFDEAETEFRKILESSPQHADAMNGLAAVLHKSKRVKEAAECYLAALRMNSNSPSTLNNFGALLRQLGQVVKAATLLKKAVTLQPGFADAWNNLGSCLSQLGIHGEATRCFETAIALQPTHKVAPNNLLFNLNYHPDLSGEDIFSAYRRWAATHAPASAIATPIRAADPGRKLRIGFVSPDFRRHSCSFFLEPLLETLDRGEFELVAYAQVARPDAVTERFQRCVDVWRSTIGLNDDALAEMIRDDGVDILIDVAGHTDGNRLKVFTRRPAPVQVSWLGFGYTTGLTAIDWFLGDPVFTPEGCEHLFAERLWRLPHVFAAYRPAAGLPAPSVLPAARNGYVTFGCLSRTVRINHRVIRTWSTLLKRIPTAKLRLDARSFSDDEVRDHFRAQFTAQGIEEDRLILGFQTPPWPVYQEIDIALDCFPHNSGTTTYEALWMGVPVLTLAERPSVGRLGASALTALGIEGWISTSEEDYVERGVAAANNLAWLEHLRTELRDRMRRSALMDEAAFARDFGGALRGMWRHACRAEATPSDDINQLLMGGQMEEAEKALLKLLRDQPQHVEANRRLGSLLLEAGKRLEAFPYLRRAALEGRDTLSRSLYADCLSRIRFGKPNNDIRADLATAIEDAWIRPADLVGTAVSLLRTDDDYRILESVLWKGGEESLSLLDSAAAKRFMADPLLLALLTAATVTDALLERILTLFRARLLTYHAEGDGTEQSQHLDFCCALANQCFAGEYAFIATEVEQDLVDRLWQHINLALQRVQPINPVWIALVACYAALDQFPGGERLLARPWPKALEAVLTRQLREPAEEKRIAGLLPRLTIIDDDTTQRVKDQYEQNPYPRWTKGPRSWAAVNFWDWIYPTFPWARRPQGPSPSGLDVLVAGCGTGQHSISTAMRYQNVRVLAIDISMSSLAYAVRKSGEAGLGNIAYAQADILKIGELNKSFDLIESAGVLHHLADPIEGWRQLSTLLRPGGFMLIGLYSKAARKQFEHLREHIRRHAFGTSSSELRRFRESVFCAPSGDSFDDIITRRDFYSLSNLRDMLFHVQERCFTIPEIAAGLKTLKLKFLGFDVGPEIRARYRETFPKDTTYTDLDQWHSLEEKHPEIFRGMYQFWVQKPL